jgi:hypothetical protein
MIADKSNTVFLKGGALMSIAQISPNSVLANPSQINPLSQATQHAVTAQAAQVAQSAIAKSKTDTVTLSTKALKMNSKASELSEEPQGQATGKPAAKGKGKG